MNYRKLRIAWSVTWGVEAILHFVVLTALVACISCRESPTPRTFERVIPIAGSTTTLADEVSNIDNLASVDITLDVPNQARSVPRPLAKQKWGSLMEVFRTTQAVDIRESLSLTGNLELVQNDGTKCEVWIYGGDVGQVIFLPHVGGSQYGGYYAAPITDNAIWSDLPIFDSRPRSDIRLRGTVVLISVVAVVAWLFTRKRFTIRDMLCALAALSCAAGLTLYFLDN